MLSVFGEFERAMIVERTKAGMARAKAQGKAIGRPVLDEGLRQEIAGRLATGASTYRVAKDMGLDRKTVSKYGAAA
jgi:putative DNA-invertase from lambdoid prophage Rac